MSSSNKLMIAALALVLSTVASAGLDAVPSGGLPIRAQAAEGPDGPGRLKARPTFRCWQYGRLIYQGPGGPVSVDRAAGAPRLMIAGGAQIYDLKSAVCILDDVGG